MTTLTPSASPLARSVTPDLRGVFRNAASSTWVVTGDAPTGPVGFTAISVVSVSVDPPLVSFNVSRTSSSLVALASTGRAALHLLADDQSDIAQRFAGDRAARFADDGAWSWGADSLPEIHGVAARLEVRVNDLHEAGDSFIAVARVTRTAIAIDARLPLIHHAGAFHTL